MNPRWTDVALTAAAPITWGTTYLVTAELLPPDRPLRAGANRARFDSSRLNNQPTCAWNSPRASPPTLSPNRHGGEFLANADTAIETTADAVRAMVHVIERMRTENVTDAELTEAKQRVAGGMLMQLQTIQQQAQFRVDGILNGYPIDYYDTYPARIAEVTADQVRAVMQKYADPNRLTIVVVAPAAQVEGQLKALGEVKVIPMPSKRGNPATQPATTREMLKPAA